MDPTFSWRNKPRKTINGERIALFLGGALVGILILFFGFKMATPLVKKACQSLLETPEKRGREARVVSVEAVVVKPGTISRRITTVGKLRANESVVIRSEMAGRIKEIAFKEGTKVKKGDALIRFEDTELKAELDKAEADVEYREVRFGRLESLQAKGLGRGTEYDQERGNLNMAKAQVEVAKAKLEKATIYAPFDGTIGLIDVSVGAFVDSQKELVTLVDFDPMKIDFKIPERHIEDLGIGQTGEVALDSMPGQIFQATVEAIDSKIDPQTHSIAARATTPNEDGKLLPGLFGRISVIVGVKNDALLIPESALSREGDIEFVWVIVNGKSGRKRVLTGTRENNQVEVTAGLRPDELVVTSGQLKLGEGTAVKITNIGGEEVELSEDEEEEDNDKPNKSASAEKKENAQSTEGEKTSTPIKSDQEKAEIAPENEKITQKEELTKKSALLGEKKEGASKPEASISTEKTEEKG